VIHPSNAIHGLWIGRHLSKLEKLTLHSFLKHGHEFNLWVYDELVEPLPPELSCATRRRSCRVSAYS